MSAYRVEKLILLIPFALLLLLQPTAAQEPSTCEDALETALSHCEGLESGQICYGAGEVHLTYQPGHPVFENPDRVRFLPGGAFLPSDAVASVQTGGDWGVAVLKVEAEHTVTMVVQGEVEMRDVSSRVSFDRTCTATAARDRMNIRPTPSTDQAAVGSLAFQSSLPITGRLADNSWYRVDMPDSNEDGWLFGEFVEISCAPEDIPVLSPEGNLVNPLLDYRPMQAFTLQTDPENPTCGGQAGVLAQSDGPAPVFVNDSVVTLDGTAVLRTDSENALVVESLAGSAEVAAGGVTHIAVPGTLVRVPAGDAAELAAAAPAIPFDAARVAGVPTAFLSESIAIPEPRNVTELRNPEMVSGVLPPGERVVYTLDATTGYYLTAYVGFQAKNPDDAEPLVGALTLVSPLGYVVEVPSGPTLGLVDDRFTQRLPVWLLETGKYQVYLSANNAEPVPFYLLIQGHDRSFCDRIIERAVGSNTFAMTYPYWGQAGQVIDLTVDATFRDDPVRPTFAVYDSVPENGALAQGQTILASSETHTLRFTVPRTSAYYVEVQVEPGTPFKLETDCE